MTPSFIKRARGLATAVGVLILAAIAFFITKDKPRPAAPHEVLPPPRHLSGDAIARIREKLDAAPGLKIEVGALRGDREALDLAAELRSVFTSSVFQVRELSEYALPPGAARGVSIYSKPEMNQVLSEAVAQIFAELGQSNKQWLSQDLEEAAKPGEPAPELKIIVGGRTGTAL